MNKFILLFFVFLTIYIPVKAAPVTSLISLDTLVNKLENSLKSTVLSSQERHHLYSVLGELTICRGVVESLPLSSREDLKHKSSSFLHQIVDQITQLQEDLRQNLKETSIDSKDFEQKTLLLGTLHLCKPSLKGAALLEDKMNDQSLAAEDVKHSLDQIK